MVYAPLACETHSSHGIHKKGQVTIKAKAQSQQPRKTRRIEAIEKTGYSSQRANTRRGNGLFKAMIGKRI